ncbi:MAG: 50S ribosomal protein L29 [Anaerolineae bacterium]|nr:50S ribosomal protein L29 [Anaerolineae bacterium]
MKSKEVSGLSAVELQGKLDDSYKEIFNLRFQRAQGQLKDTNAIRKVRRDIARVKTVLRQRELAAEIMAKAAPASE